MIESFVGDYKFLSNFWYFDQPMKYQGMEFSTNEHFYIAMKTEDLEVRNFISNHPIKGVKKFGSQVLLRSDWEDIKLEVMLYGLRYKFSECNLKLRKSLLDTKELHIQEGNYWNDKFYGVCLKTGEGKNHLGRLLMQVRSEIKEGK